MKFEKIKLYRGELTFQGFFHQIIVTSDHNPAVVSLFPGLGIAADDSFSTFDIDFDRENDVLNDSDIIMNNNMLRAQLADFDISRPGPETYPFF